MLVYSFIQRIIIYLKFILFVRRQEKKKTENDNDWYNMSLKRRNNLEKIRDQAQRAKIHFKKSCCETVIFLPHFQWYFSLFGPVFTSERLNIRDIRNEI